MIENNKPYRGIHRDSGWTWLTSECSRLEVGEWYKSKRGYVVFVEDINRKPKSKDTKEYAHVRVHTTGNILYLSEEQVSWFSKTEDPGTPCGTALLQHTESELTSISGKSSTISKYDHIYTKYAHVVNGSVYRIQNVAQDKTPTWEHKRKGKKLNIKGQVRCKIECQNCGQERDIKVQDAFQVKLCLDCKGKKRKKNLKKFLDKKSKETK